MKPTPISPSHNPAPQRKHRARSSTRVLRQSQLGNVELRDGMVILTGNIAERVERLAKITGKDPEKISNQALGNYLADHCGEHPIQVTIEFVPGTQPHHELLAMMRESGCAPDEIVAAMIDNDMRQHVGEPDLMVTESAMVEEYAEETPPEPSTRYLSTPPHAERVLPVDVRLRKEEAK